MAILGPEIAHRRRISDGSAKVPTGARVPTPPEGDSGRPVAIGGIAAADGPVPELLQDERRRVVSQGVSGPDRRRPEDRRTSTDRRATPAARERRLTPAGRHALDLLGVTAETPVSLTGDTGLLSALVTGVLQRGLEVEIAAHLGHGRWDAGSRGAGNIRNGAYPKRVLTDLGVITVQMPRDRRGTFEPVVVPKHGRRLLVPTSNLAAIYASGMTRSEIRSQLDTVSQSRLSRTIVESFTDQMELEVRAWQRRHFESSYPLVLIDAIVLNGRTARMTRRSLDVAVAIDAYGDVELLGLWRRPSRAGPGPERWAPMLDELHYRGITAIEFIAGAGDSGLGEAAGSVFPLAQVRPGVEALLQNTLRFSE